MSGEATRRLVIIPDEESFVKPLDASMVLTCKVVTSDGREEPVGSRLKWMGNNNQEIVDANGRFHATSIILYYNEELRAIAGERASQISAPRLGYARIE